MPKQAILKLLLSKYSIQLFTKFRNIFTK